MTKPDEKSVLWPASAASSAKSKKQSGMNAPPQRVARDFGTFGKGSSLAARSYDTDDARSIPSSFTRSAAAPDASLFSADSDTELKTSADTGGVVANTTSGSSSNPSRRSVKPARSGEENWDEDFDFSISPTKKEKCSLVNAEESSSLWESDGSNEERQVASGSRDRSVIRSTSNRTITAVDRANQRKPQPSADLARADEPPIPSRRRSSVVGGSQRTPGKQGSEVADIKALPPSPSTYKGGTNTEVPASNTAPSGSEHVGQKASKRKSGITGSSVDRLLTRMMNRFGRRQDVAVQQQVPTVEKRSTDQSKDTLRAVQPRAALPAVSKDTFGRSARIEARMVDEDASVNSDYAARTLPRSFAEVYASSEQRQWASKLQDGPREGRRSRLQQNDSSSDSGSGYRRRTGSRTSATHKDSAYDGPSAASSSSSKRKQVGGVPVAEGPVNPTVHPSIPRVRYTSKRSFSGSTADSVDSSVERAASLSSAVITDVSFDSLVESQKAALKTSRQASSNSGSDPRQSEGKIGRHVPKRGPPPISSGIDSYSRRTANARPSLQSAWDPSRSDEEQGTAESKSISGRRDSGGLRIPARISNAQDALRSDIASIRMFAKGIEELQKLVLTHQDLVDILDRTSRTRREEVERTEFGYATWWECAEVLLDLAKGKEGLDDADRGMPSPGLGGARRDSNVGGSHDSGPNCVRRGDVNVSSSRASSTASRLVTPERERSILAAMLAGTSPESTHRSTSMVDVSKRMDRVRTVSGGASLISNNSPIERRSRHISELRPSNDVRRTSDPYTSSIDDQPPRQGAPPQSYFDAHLHAVNLEAETTLESKNGRQRLRGAGQSGLTGIRLLISTLRTNSTLDRGQENATRETRRERKDSQASTSQKSHSSRFWKGLRRAPSSEMGTSTESDQTSSRDTRELQSALRELDLSGESQWTEAGLTSSDSVQQRKSNFKASSPKQSTPTRKTESPQMTSSDTFRRLAMRPEAMPSLNRYLDITLSRCHECLAVLQTIAPDQMR